MFKKLRDLDLTSLIQNLTDNKNRNRTVQRNQKRRPNFGYDALEPRKMLHGDDVTPLSLLNGQFDTNPAHTFVIDSISALNVEQGETGAVTISGVIERPGSVFTSWA